MADVKTSWEIELIDAMSAPAKRAESALARIQRRMEQIGARGGAMAAIGRSARAAFAYIDTAAYATALRLRQAFGGSIVARGFQALRANARSAFAYVNTAAYASSQLIRRRLAESMIVRSARGAGASVAGAASSLAGRASGAASTAGGLAVSAGRALFGTGSGTRAASAISAAYGAARASVVGHFAAIRASASQTFAYVSTIAYVASLRVRKAFGESMVSAFNRAGKAIRKAIPKALSAASSKLLEYSKNAVLFAGVLAGAAAAKIGATAVGMTDFSQKSRKALEMMTGSVETGNAAFEKFRRTALDMGMGIKTSVLNAQSLLAKGFAVPETDALLRMGADMTAVGSSAEKVQSVFDAMGKIKATGYLQGDELNMLVEAGISSSKIYGALGAKLGKTTQELIKMKEAGKLAAKDVLNAVGAAVLQTTGQTEFGAARGKIKASTLSGMWDTIKTNTENVWLRIGESSGAGFVKAFGSISKKLNAMVTGKGADRTVALISAGIESVSKWIDRAIPGIEKFVSSFGSGFADAMRAIGPALAQFSGSGTGWNSTLKTLGTTLGQLTALAMAAAGVFGGEMVAAMIVAANVVQGGIWAWNGILSAIGAVIFAVDDWLENLGAKWRALSFGAVGDLIQGILDGIAGGIGAVIDAAAGLARSVVDAFRGPEGIDAHSPSRKFQDLADLSVEGYVGRFRDAANDTGMPGVPMPALRGAATGGGGGGKVVNITLTVQAPPGGTKSDGEAWGRGAARGLRGALAGELEDASLETGT